MLLFSLFFGCENANFVRYVRDIDLMLGQLKVAIITSQRDTYVEFLYPSSGLNWLQGDIGESGLPDIRPQSGFVAEDGRFYTLPGSGSDSVGSPF